MESMAWHLDRNQGRCPDCDGRLSETTDPDSEDTYLVELRRCHKCKSRHDATKGFDSESREGLLAFVAREDTP